LPVIRQHRAREPSGTLMALLGCTRVSLEGGWIVQVVHELAPAIATIA
jgi:hypothetical protein